MELTKEVLKTFWKKIEEARKTIFMATKNKNPNSYSTELTVIIQDVCTSIPDKEFSDSELKRLDGLLDNLIKYKQISNKKLEGTDELVKLLYNQHFKKVKHYADLLKQLPNRVVAVEWGRKLNKHSTYCMKLKKEFPGLLPDKDLEKEPEEYEVQDLDDSDYSYM